jgi:HEPN domain-containing protein
MNRKDFQQLAEIRLKEAEALLAADCFEGSYYLAGYAVECAFKACIAKKTQEHDFPDKKLVERSHTHDLERLADAAGLLKLIENEVKSDKAFETNWGSVREWTCIAGIDIFRR